MIKILSAHLPLEGWLEKAEAESAYWYKQAMQSRDAVEEQAGVIRELRAELEKARRTIADDAERFEAITTFWHEARRTGYNTSWSIGGVTAECLRTETMAARNYKAPETLPKAHLVQVGGLVSSGDSAGRLFPTKEIPRGETYSPLFVVQAPATVAKKKGVPKK